MYFNPAQGGVDSTLLPRVLFVKDSFRDVLTIPLVGIPKQLLAVRIS